MVMVRTDSAPALTAGELEALSRLDASARSAPAAAADLAAALPIAAPLVLCWTRDELEAHDGAILRALAPWVAWGLPPRLRFVTDSTREGVREYAQAIEDTLYAFASWPVERRAVAREAGRAVRRFARDPSIASWLATRDPTVPLMNQPQWWRPIAARALELAKAEPRPPGDPALQAQAGSILTDSLAKAFAQSKADDYARKVIAQVDTYWKHFQVVAPGPNALADVLSKVPAMPDTYAENFAKRQEQYLSAVRYFFGDKVAEWAHDVMTWGGLLPAAHDERYDQKWLDEANSLWAQAFNEGFPPFFVDFFSPMNPDQLKNGAMNMIARLRELAPPESEAIKAMWLATQVQVKQAPIAFVIAYGARAAFIPDPAIDGKTPEIAGLGSFRGDAFNKPVCFAVFAARVFAVANNAPSSDVEVATMRRTLAELYEPMRDSDGDLIPSGSWPANDDIRLCGRVARIAQDEAKARWKPSPLMQALANVLSGSSSSSSTPDAVGGGGVFASPFGGTVSGGASSTSSSSSSGGGGAVVLALGVAAVLAFGGKNL